MYLLRTLTPARLTARLMATQSHGSVSLTSEAYPHVKRGNYAQLAESDVVTFERILEKHRVITDPADLEAHNTDWMHSWRGQSRLLLKPKTTDEVSAILRHCCQRHLAVVPQGGNTGLVGGSVPVFDEIIVSTQLMNEVLQINEVSGIVVCQAGVVLEQLDNRLAKQGLLVPLDLGAKGSCHIGGNVATNAGGLRLLRYGSLHGSILGLEAVLPSGQVLDCLNALRKDNTGYDLKQLFIGSEGTLGVITTVALLCPTRPRAVNVAVFGCDRFDQVLQTFKTAREELGEILSAFELIDDAAAQVVQDNLNLRAPLASAHPYLVLVETSGSREEHDGDKITGFLDRVMAEGAVVDGIVAQDNTQIQRLWKFREDLAMGHAKARWFVMHDVSVAPELMGELIDDVRRMVAREQEAVAAGLRITFFGHLGDGNLHLNLVAPTPLPAVLDKLEPQIYSWLREHRGSISAEHGLGFKKPHDLHYSKTDIAIRTMRQIKTLFDPQGIMNPYKYLPSPTDGKIE